MKFRSAGVLVVALLFVLTVAHTSLASTYDITITPDTDGVWDTDLPRATGADGSPSGWGGTSFKSNGTGASKVQLNLFSILGYDVKISDISSMSYWTKQGTTSSITSWYLQIYTKPAAGASGWYTSRINAETYLSAGQTDSGGDWVQWSTAPDGVDELRFGYSGTFGGDLSWQDVVGIYGNETVLQLCLGVGTDWADNFTDLVDGLTINLNDGNTVNVNLQATPIPGAVWLLGSGLVGLVGLKRKKLKA